jgi:amidase
MATADDLHCFVPTTREIPPTGEGGLSSARVALKDLIEVAGHTSSFGHPRWRDTHAPARRDAEVIRRLREAGASIAGFAKMDQLAYSLVGNVGEGIPPVNVVDAECFAGGSSSGSAAAVAGGIADVGVGTDTAARSASPPRRAASTR